jgi:hypothetical protein
VSSGIELVLSQGKGALVQFVMLDGVAAKKWAAIPEVELWQAVALHSSLDPDLMGGSWEDLNRYFLFEEALQDLLDSLPSSCTPDEVARRGARGRSPEELLRESLKRAGHAATMESLRCSSLHDREAMLSQVPLAEFLGWAIRTALPVIGGFPNRAASAPATRWPWGSHTTTKLELLAKAGEHWRLAAEGGRYVPGDIKTAPHSKVIVAWLIEKGLNQAAAESIASMLRPPSVRTGPR